jgi:hypothetical protein
VTLGKLLALQAGEEGLLLLLLLLLLKFHRLQCLVGFVHFNLHHMNVQQMLPQPKHSGVQQNAQRHDVKHHLVRVRQHYQAARMLLFLVAVTCCCCCWLQGELLQQMAINRARLGLVLQVRI